MEPREDSRGKPLGPARAALGRRGARKVLGRTRKTPPLPPVPDDDGTVEFYGSTIEPKK